jgi:hypothetical protein
MHPAAATQHAAATNASPADRIRATDLPQGVFMARFS